MSLQASNNFITSFDAMVKQAYQGASKLRNTVRLKSGVQGSTHQFPTMGKGLAQSRVRLTDVTAMNVSQNKATATLSDWVAPEYVDIFDINKLAFDEKQNLAQAVSNALGRRLDQLVIDAMSTSAFATQVGVNTGGSNTNINLEKILRAKALLDKNGVPNDGNRHMAISAQGLEGALLETEISSSDFNVMKALMTGEIKTYAGFQFHVIEDRTEGGLPKTSTTRNNFAWHKDAVGLAIGMDQRTEINYIAEKTSWLVNGMLSAGAISIDTDGIIDVLAIESY